MSGYGASSLAFQHRRSAEKLTLVGTRQREIPLELVERALQNASCADKVLPFELVAQQRDTHGQWFDKNADAANLPVLLVILDECRQINRFARDE